MRDRFPRLDVHPIATDFTSDFDIPAHVPAKRRVAFFPRLDDRQSRHGRSSGVSTADAPPRRPRRPCDHRRRSQERYPDADRRL
ncbi:MAG: hypothetical protein WDN29_16590 [Methylovirgula sp.]